jgi:hypothetical protein
LWKVPELVICCRCGRIGWLGKIDEEEGDDHINRHGDTTQNVLSVCDFNMRFVYVAAGIEGSAHDMRVKKKAELDPYFPHPPPG